jgi:hypothetical protein
MLAERLLQGHMLAGKQGSTRFRVGWSTCIFRVEYKV